MGCASSGQEAGCGTCGILEFPMKQRDTTWPGTQIQAAFDRGH